MITELWAKSILKIVQKRKKLDPKLVVEKIRFEVESLYTDRIIGSIITKVEELLNTYIKEKWTRSK